MSDLHDNSIERVFLRKKMAAAIGNSTQRKGHSPHSLADKALDAIEDYIDWRITRIHAKRERSDTDGHRGRQ